MIVWSDGESTIEHRAKCNCSYCIIDRSRFQYAMEHAGVWQGHYRSGKYNDNVRQDLFE